MAFSIREESTKTSDSPEGPENTSEPEVTTQQYSAKSSARGFLLNQQDRHALALQRPRGAHARRPFT